MKIGILTLGPGLNYGGILQAWALQTVLRRRGHDARTLIFNSMLPYGLCKSLVLYAYRTWLRIRWGKRAMPVFREHYNHKLEQAVGGKMREFVDQRMKTATYGKPTDISRGDFDGFVVGSDQVWRHYVTASLRANIENAYLDFADGWDVKRVAYAASFGRNSTEGYSRRALRRCRDLIARFDAVSVRDEMSAGMCRRLYDARAELVADPTLLLKREDYLSLLTDNKSVTEKFRGEKIQFWAMGLSLFCSIMYSLLITENGSMHLWWPGGWVWRR